MILGWVDAEWIYHYESIDWIYGRWLMAMTPGSCFMSQGSRLMPRASWPRTRAALGPEPRPRAPFFGMGPKSWIVSHETWAMRHEPVTINTWLIRIVMMINSCIFLQKLSVRFAVTSSVCFQTAEFSESWVQTPKEPNKHETSKKMRTEKWQPSVSGMIPQHPQPPAFTTWLKSPSIFSSRIFFYS